MKWGERGKGAWITVYTNPGHAYAVIAGLRLDTSVAGMSRTRKTKAAVKAFESGPRWRPMARSRRGFVKRHPLSVLDARRNPSAVCAPGRVRLMQTPTRR